LSHSSEWTLIELIINVYFYEQEWKEFLHEIALYACLVYTIEWWIELLTLGTKVTIIIISNLISDISF